MFVLFFLCCMLLCGSVLALNLSHQIQAGNEAVDKEQSRLLARSGWNMALEQLQLSGNTDAIQHTAGNGTIMVELQESPASIATWEIVSTGECGAYSRTASGIVQCFFFPFARTVSWPVLEFLQEQTEAGILLVEDTMYRLPSDCVYSLGIASANQRSIIVEVTDEITAETLYIHGDLYVSGALTAEQLHVSGEISGSENIQCDVVYSGYSNDMLYQIRVLERNAV